MIPTDKQLNEVAARVCGWKLRKLPEPDAMRYCWYHKDSGRWSVDCPRFCTDRNALAELLTKIHTMVIGSRIDFGNQLLTLIDRGLTEPACVCVLPILTASPRTVVIAALKAVGEWLLEWEAAVG